MKTMPQNFAVGNVDVDYSLIGQGVYFTDDYFSVVMNGTVHLANQSLPRGHAFTEMPVHNDDGSEIQLMISEYSINSVLFTAVELNVLNYTNTEQTSATLQVILSDFERAYGEVANVTIVAQAHPDMTKYAPSIKISPGGSSLDFYVDIHVRNPYDTTIDAALITAKIVTNISFSVNSDFELSGAINNFDLSVIDFEPYFKTPTTKLGINTKLFFGKNIIESYINGFLDDGYKLPLPQNITKFIKNQEVVCKEGYLLVDGDAEFTDKKPEEPAQVLSRRML